MDKFLLEFYRKAVFRKLRRHALVNKTRGEESLVRRFRETFGPPSEIVICFGDWSPPQGVRFKLSTPGMGLRRLFRQHGYLTYLIDEFRTSCRCSICGNECTKPMTRVIRHNERCKCRSQNQKRKRKKCTCRDKKVHGLLRCTHTSCNMYFNRDVNGARNIYKLARAAINDEERPEYMRRSE